MKFKWILVLLICIVVVSVSVYFVLQFVRNNNEDIAEYTPQQEITDEQLRKTIVSLYFKDEQSKELVPEARLIDAKLLISDPYSLLVQMLIDGPKNQSLVSTIPLGTKLNGVKFVDGNIIVDLSSEFVKNHTGNDEEKFLTLYSIVNTLTELNEVNGVSFLIDGTQMDKFGDSDIDISKIFVRENESDGE